MTTPPRGPNFAPTPGSPWESLPRIPVTSSNVAWVARDGAVGRLYVGFRSGAVYAYDRVPRDVYDGLLAAPSKGHYLFEVIRAGGTDSRYAYRQVR